MSREKIIEKKQRSSPMEELRSNTTIMERIRKRAVLYSSSITYFKRWKKVIRTSKDKNVKKVKMLLIERTQFKKSKTIIPKEVHKGQQGML
jgi:hypothetical protein